MFVAACSLLLWRGGCRPSVRIATFNIRMFPEPTTDLERVATTIAALDEESILQIAVLLDDNTVQIIDLADKSQVARLGLGLVQ